MDKLTDKQKRFVSEYLIDLNATQAAIRAGYAAKTAGSSGQRMLKNVEIQKAITELKKQREEKTEADGIYVINRLHEIAEMDVADILNDDLSFKPVSKWPKIWRQYLSGIDILELMSGEEPKIVKKIKWPDKVKNLELLGRHFGVFNDKMDVTSNGQTIQSGVLLMPEVKDKSAWETKY